MKETEAGRAERGLLLALAVDPEGVSRSDLGLIKRSDVPALTVALERAIYAGVNLRRLELGAAGTTASWSPDGRRIGDGVGRQHGADLERGKRPGGACARRTSGAGL